MPLAVNGFGQRTADIFFKLCPGTADDSRKSAYCLNADNGTGLAAAFLDSSGCRAISLISWLSSKFGSFSNSSSCKRKIRGVSTILNVPQAPRHSLFDRRQIPLYSHTSCTQSEHGYAIFSIAALPSGTYGAGCTEDTMCLKILFDAEALLRQLKKLLQLHIQMLYCLCWEAAAMRRPCMSHGSRSTLAAADSILHAVCAP